MEKLPPIPSPPGTAFREFRIGLLPYMVFAAAIALTTFVWRDYVGPTSLVGEAEMVRRIVSASQPSRIKKVHVGALHPVKAGDPLIDLEPADVRYLEAQASQSRARIELYRATVEPLIRRENNKVNLTQLQLDWFSQRAELAAMRAQLSYHVAEADRITRLSKVTNGIPFVTVQELQIAQRDLDVLRSQITNREELVDEIGRQLKKLEVDLNEKLDTIAPLTRNPLETDMKAVEAIEEQLRPVTLLAPEDGFVSIIHRRGGEMVLPGEPILIISSTKSERIIAFVRQPVRADIQKGMQVEIRSRSKRASAIGEVLEVGGQMEPILPELLPLRPSGGSNSLEYGLPITVSIPLELQLIPGELVDLRPKP